MLAAIAAVLLVAITALRFAFDTQSDPLGSLYALPVVLVAIGVGRRAGVAVSVLALLLYGVQRSAQDLELAPLAFASRGVTWVALSVALGTYVERSRRAESELRALRERYEQILSSASEGIFGLDSQGAAVFVNPAGARILGYDVHDLIGRSMHEAVHHSYSDGTRYPLGLCPIYAALSDGSAHRVEDEVFWDRNGEPVPVQYVSSPIEQDGAAVGAVVVFTNVRDRKRAERSLADEREFLRAVLDSVRDGIVACDRDGTLTYFNRATQDLHGLPAEPLAPGEWAGHYNLYGPDGQTPLEREEVPLFQALSGEVVRDAEMVITPMDGEARRVLAYGQPIIDGQGEKLGAVVAMHDITEHRRAEQQLIHQALHDSLTGLPNRTLMADRLDHALGLAQRGLWTVALLFIDVDRFKIVNDTHGHESGDRLLVAITERLTETLRVIDMVGRSGSDTLSRFGGDEFVVLCEQLGDEHDAVVIAERIVKGFSAPFTVGGRELQVTASIGLAIAQGATATTADELLRDADAAMYRAKERGRARYEIFDDAMRSRLLGRVQDEQELRQAIAEAQLTVHYQPIVSVADGHPVAVEALMRWHHPVRGLIPPGDFIPLAEESGLIVEMGEWVLEQACRDASSWRGRDPAHTPLRIAVNLSARQLGDRTLVTRVAEILQRTGVDPGRLELEITESVLMEDSDAPHETLAGLRTLGVRLVLDDFGTGYSSLSYLQRLPLDVLKIDRSFVRPLGESAEDARIAGAIVELARGLGLTVVAEGVETETQLECLRELNCPLAQGFYFARPAPAEEIAGVLRARESL